MSELPEAIVFIHRGLPSYLICAIFQARNSNPEIRIILISDINPKISFVEWHDLNALSEHWKPMADAYVHLNTCVEELVRLWFYRWFALYAVMESRNLASVLHLDSDVLLYAPLNTEMPEFGDAVLAIGSEGSHSGHCAFIRTREALLKTCRFMMTMFTDPERQEVLRRHFEKQRMKPGQGGVCDMYAFGWLTRDKVVPVFELNEVRNGIVFDQSAGSDGSTDCQRHWDMCDGMKRIILEDARPHFVSLAGEHVKAATIHFQGGLKRRMPHFMQSRAPLFFWHWLPLRVAEWIQDQWHPVRMRLRHYRRGLVKRCRRLVSVVEKATGGSVRQ